MNENSVLGFRWLQLGLLRETARVPRRPGSHSPFLASCPHCTNVDTLEPHCSNASCRWVSCSCGALVYTRRRHRHPRHGSARDTCHNPAAAV